MTGWMVGVSTFHEPQAQGTDYPCLCVCSLKCMSECLFFFFDTLGAAFHSAADTAATSRGAPTGLGDAENEAEGTRCRRTGEAGGEVGEALGAESDSASKGEPRLREERSLQEVVGESTRCGSSDASSRCTLISHT